MRKSAKNAFLSKLVIVAAMIAVLSFQAFAYSTYVAFDESRAVTGKATKIAYTDAKLSSGNYYKVVISQNTANYTLYANLVKPDGTMSTTGIINGTGNTDVYVSSSGTYSLYLYHDGIYTTWVKGYYRSLT